MMSLTLKQPQTVHDSTTSFHDSPLPTPPATTRFSPAVTGTSLPSLSASTSRIMSTAHRGLPLPAAMTLSNPNPPPQPGPSTMAQPGPPLSAPLPGQMAGALPAPPAEWRNAEESMRNWLAAKQEEDKRRQEEEKTRQESLRLEQRRIEQSMLHESFQHGVPPYMVPMVFAGMGGGSLPNASLEWAQHHMAQIQQLQQLHQQQQQQQQQQQSTTATQPPSGQAQVVPPAQASPDPRRDTRVVNQIQANPYASQPPLPQPAGSAHGSPATFLTPYQASATSPPNRSDVLSFGQASAPTSAPRPPGLGSGSAVLPKLNTGEMQIQPPGQDPATVARATAMHSAHASPAMHGNAPSHESAQSSPNIFFHHWVPPTPQPGPKEKESKDGKEPLTPSENASPRKRKAHGQHQAAPAPSSQPSFTSPSFSQTGSNTSTPSSRRTGHVRNRSDTTSTATHKFDTYAKSSSRVRQMDVNGGHEGYRSKMAESSPRVSASGGVGGGSSRDVIMSDASPPQAGSKLQPQAARSRTPSHEAGSGRRYSTGPEKGGGGDEQSPSGTAHSSHSVSSLDRPRAGSEGGPRHPHPHYGRGGDRAPYPTTTTTTASSSSSAAPASVTASTSRA